MIRMESTKQKADARAEQDHLRAALAHGRGQASIFDEDLELVAGQRLLVTTQLAMKVNISYNTLSVS